MASKLPFAGMAVSALVMGSATARAAECQPTNLFTDLFAGGPQANCTVGDKSILGNSWNAVGQNSGFELTNVFPTPSNDPGLEFFVNTELVFGDGASYVYTVTAPSASPITGVSANFETIDTNGGTNSFEIQVSSGSDFLGSFAVGDNATDSISFAGVTSITITSTLSSSSLGLGSITERFQESPAVPEPATWTLLGAGFSALALRRRRRSAASKA